MFFKIVVIDSWLSMGKKKVEVPTNWQVLWKSSNQSCLYQVTLKTKQNKQNKNYGGLWKCFIHKVSDFSVNHGGGRGGLASCFGSEAKENSTALWLAWALTAEAVHSCGAALGVWEN